MSTSLRKPTSANKFSVAFSFGIVLGTIAVTAAARADDLWTTNSINLRSLRTGSDSLPSTTRDTAKKKNKAATDKDASVLWPSTSTQIHSTSHGNFDAAGNGLGNGLSTPAVPSQRKNGDLFIAGSGMGNGSGGVILKPGSATGAEGNENSCIVTATMASPLVVQKLRCTLKMDDSIKFLAYSGEVRTYQNGSETKRFRGSTPDTSVEAALTHYAQNASLDLLCARTTTYFNDVDALASLTYLGSSNDDTSLSSAYDGIGNKSVVLSLVTATYDHQKIYQSSDSLSPVAREIEDLFASLTDSSTGDSFRIPLSQSGGFGFFSGRRTNNDKIHTLSQVIDLATPFKKESNQASIEISQPIGLTFNWKNVDAFPLQQTLASVSVGVMVKQGHDKKVLQGQEFTIGLIISADAQEKINSLNSWLSAIQAADLILSISDRPTIISYLSNLDHDLGILTQFRQRILDPLQPLTTQASVYGYVFNALQDVFRNRLAASLKAEQMVSATSGLPNMAQIRMVDNRLERDIPISQDAQYALDSVLPSAMADWIASRSCGEFTCPTLESDLNRLAGLSESFKHGLGLLPKKGASTDVISDATGATNSVVLDSISTGCKFLPQILRSLAELHNNFFIQVKEVSTAPQYADNAYVKTVYASFMDLKDLNQRHYDEESPTELLEDIRPDWQTVCVEDRPQIDKELASFRAKPSAEIDREFRKFKKEE